MLVGWMVTERPSDWDDVAYELPPFVGFYGGEEYGVGLGEVGVVDD